MIYLAGTDFSHLTNDELIKGIKALDLPDYIRSKAYGVDVRETLAQMTEMTIQLGVNMGLSPEDALVWARKLQESVSQSEFDSWIATLLDGGPSIFMNTLSELQTTYPNGAAGVALVRETDPAKIYVWDDGAWEDFGDYQGVEVKDGSITSAKLLDGAVTPEKTTFMQNVVVSEAETDAYQNIGVTGNSNYEFGSVVAGGDRRSLVFKAEPNTTYKITKEPSDLFRIGNTLDYPVDGTRHYFIKDEFTSGLDESTETEFTFTTGATNLFIIVYVSNIGEEPAMTIEALKLTKESVANRSITPSSTTFMVHRISTDDTAYEKIGTPGNSESILSLRSIVASDNRRSLVFKAKPNTTYKVTKDPSSLFRIARIHNASEYPAVGTNYQFIKDEFETGLDESTEIEYTFTTGVEQWVIIYVSNINEEPKMVIEEVHQIEPNYKIPMEYIRGLGVGVGGNTSTVSVEDFRTEITDTDTTTIQKAFDNAGGRIVEFESGRVYHTTSQLIADAGKVRGIEGNSAKIIADLDGISALKYYGSLNPPGPTGPNYAPNDLIAENEMNGFINRLNIRSKTPYLADGIEVGNSIGLTVQNCKMYKLRNGLITSGGARNFIYENNYIYNNSQNGMLFDDVDLHQFQIIGGHISYNYNNIKFIDSDMANGQLTGVSLENNWGNENTGFTKSGSLITFESTGVIKTAKKHLYEAFMITGCNIQDHNTNNTGPLINMDVPENGISDIMIGNNLIGNSAANVPAVFMRGVNGANLNNNSIVGYAYAMFNTSIKIAGVNKLININNNHLEKPIDYSEATITKMKISDNLLEDFTMSDSNDGNIMIKDNF